MRLAAVLFTSVLLVPLSARSQTVTPDREVSDASPSQAPAGEVNAANNPLTPKITVNLQDYFLPSLNRLGNRQANQGLLRGLVPSDAFGVPQLIRFTLPLVTTPTFPSGSDTGLGDLTVFDLVVIPTKSVVFGVGPLLVAPTATSRNTGTGKWQGGAAAVGVAPQSWGLLAGLVTYQHSFAGDDYRPTAQIVTAQPIVTYNLPDGLLPALDRRDDIRPWKPHDDDSGRFWRRQGLVVRKRQYGKRVRGTAVFRHPQRRGCPHLADLRRHQFPVRALTLQRGLYKMKCCPYERNAPCRPSRRHSS